MGSKPNDAFANLMSSVPGVDTSGFVKKSLNDLKSKRKDLKACQFQSIQSRGVSVPHSGSSSSSSMPPRAASAVHRTNDVKIDGLSAAWPELGKAGKETGLKSATGGVKASSAAPGVFQIGSGDLDWLGGTKPDPEKSGMHVETKSVDPFEAFPGTEVVADIQEPGSGINDLLGSGFGTTGTFHLESKTEFVDLDPNLYSDTKKIYGSHKFETTGESNQCPDDDHNDLVGFVSAATCEGESLQMPKGDPFIENDALNQPSPVDESSQEAYDAAGDPKDYESDMDSDDIYSAVVLEDRSHRRQKFGGLPPHLSAAGKSVLARISRSKKTSEDTGEDSGGQSRFSKYSSSLQRKAVEYSKKGLGAVKQGLEAASDWVDKQMDEKKRALSGKRSPESELDAEVVEMAAELNKLSPADRLLVLEHIDADMKKKVSELLASQEFIRPDLSNHGTTVSSEKEEGQSESWSEGINKAQERTGSQTLQRPVSIPDFRTVRSGEQTLHSGGKSAPTLHNPYAEDDMDILGLGEDIEKKGSSSQSSDQANVITDTKDPDDLDDFFGGGSYQTPQAQTKNEPQQPNPMEDIFGEPSVRFNEDLIDIGAQTNTISEEHSHLYKEHQETSSNEPHIRRVLREQRTREKHMKMQDALQDKLLREQEQIEFQENQQGLKRAIGPKIREWKDANHGNIRGLLATLHSVLWEDSGWVKLSVGDILDSAQVKKAYRKANLIVHPDKVRQKNGTEDQTAIADMVFDVLKEAWSQFNG